MSRARVGAIRLARSKRGVGTFRAALILFDVVLLAANLLHLTVNEPDEPDEPNIRIFSNQAWNGNWDGSLIEVFGYLQLFAGSVLLLLLWRRTRKSVYGAWALVFLMVIADDALMLHENGGAILVTAGLPSIAGLRPQDLGEIAVWAVMGVALGVALVGSYLRSPQRERRNSRVLFVLLGLLVGFAAGLDVIQSALADVIPPLGMTLLTLIETAGELGAMTLMLLAVHAMTLRLARRG